MTTTTTTTTTFVDAEGATLSVGDRVYVNRPDIVEEHGTIVRLAPAGPLAVWDCADVVTDDGRTFAIPTADVIRDTEPTETLSLTFTRGRLLFSTTDGHAAFIVETDGPIRGRELVWAVRSGESVGRVIPATAFGAYVNGSD